jgi:hypothetical protein
MVNFSVPAIEIQDMPVIVADFVPGGLTAYFVILLSSLLVGIGLVGAAIMFLVRKRDAARALLKIAGVAFGCGLLLVFLATIFGRVLNLK